MKKILFLSLFLMICAVLSAQKRIKVACVGNSITYGYTLPNPATDSYPSQLQQLLGDTYEVGNFGKSGATLLNKGHRPYMQQEEFKKRLPLSVILLLFTWESMIRILVTGRTIVIIS